MKFSIEAVFCEVVSGIGFILTFLPIFICSGWINLIQIEQCIMKMEVASLVSFVLAMYILGVILNIIGLPADKLSKCIKLKEPTPTDESVKLFYKKASPELFNFRTNVWNHYYCFRNLLVFSPLALILWAIFGIIYWDAYVTIVFVIFFMFMIYILYHSVKEHANFYITVTEAFIDK